MHIYFKTNSHSEIKRLVEQTIFTVFTGRQLHMHIRRKKGTRLKAHIQAKVNKFT